MMVRKTALTCIRYITVPLMLCSLSTKVSKHLGWPVWSVFMIFWTDWCQMGRLTDRQKRLPTTFCQGWDYYLIKVTNCNDIFIFSIRFTCVQLWASECDLISIVCGAYNGCKLWTHGTSVLLSNWIIVWKYVCKNLSCYVGYKVVINIGVWAIELWTHVT